MMHYSFAMWLDSICKNLRNFSSMVMKDIGLWISCYVMLSSGFDIISAYGKSWDVFHSLLFSERTCRKWVIFHLYMYHTVVKPSGTLSLHCLRFLIINPISLTGTKVLKFIFQEIWSFHLKCGAYRYKSVINPDFPL